MAEILDDFEFGEPKKRKMPLDPHDEALMQTVREAILRACEDANSRYRVACRLHSVAYNEKQRGKGKAEKKYLFDGKCAVSGRDLERADAQLQADPKKGYEGICRWVCAKANGNGKKSCGGC